MVAIYRLSSDQFTTRRIDPWHYQPEFAKRVQKILDGVGGIRLVNVVDDGRGIAGGATPLGADYLAKGRVKFYRTSEIDEMNLDHEQAVYISDEDDQQLERSRLMVGDIILTITGAKFGKSAVVQQEHLPGNISQHSVRFHPKEEFDPYYLVAYLNGQTGQIAIWREAYGATRPAIDYPGIRSLVIPNLNSDAQAYIGEKVRQAERLREWVKSLSKVIAELLSEFNPEDLEQGIISRVEDGDLWDTINPNSYMPQYMSALEKVKRHECHSIASLSQVVADGPFGSNLKVDDYLLEQHGRHPIVRVKNCNDGELDTSDMAWISAAKQQELIRSEVKANDLLVTKAGRIGSTAVYPEGLPNGNITSHLIRARLETISPYYVAAFLETRVGRLLTEQHSFKSTRPELTKAEIEVCLVPILDESVISEVDSTARQKYSANSMAKLLVAASKLIVEALIEKKIGESDLISAQRALESGDSSLDRDILSRLKIDGLDGKGDPLFPDLDRLYDLLEQAEQTMAE